MSNRVYLNHAGLNNQQRLLPRMTIMSLILYLLITFVIPLKANDDNNCYLEEGYQYDDHIGGMNNQTSLRMCNDVREENICIVGGGLSGVHMGWLLKRRGAKSIMTSLMTC